MAGVTVRPLIAITPDRCEISDRPTEAEYRLRCNYADAVLRAGGAPAALPYQPDAASLAETFDGVLVSGGAPGVSDQPGRTDFELALIEAALRLGRPLLGVCNGMQLIGRALGAALVERIADETPGTIDHIPAPLPTALAHPVRLSPGSRLAGLAGAREAQVNSLHRQAIRDAGDFHVAARAPDGVVEAIEGRGAAFCVGVQWHPEYGLTPLDRAIFSAFVAACAERRPG